MSWMRMSPGDNVVSRPPWLPTIDPRRRYQSWIDRGSNELISARVRELVVGCVTTCVSASGPRRY
jgi:hypothetical protein